MVTILLQQVTCSRVHVFSSSVSKKKRTLKYKQEININARTHDDDNALLCMWGAGMCNFKYI